MERKEPTRRITSRIRKTDVAAAPTPAAEPKRGTAGIKKRSTGDKMVASAKPPSTVGKVVKLVLVLTVVLGIPGITLAGFLDKDKKGRNRWYRLGIQIGLIQGAPKIVTAAKPPHPNVVGYNDAVAQLIYHKNEMLRIRRVFEQHDAAAPWEKEQALQLHADLDKVRDHVGKLMDLLEKQAG